MTLFSLCPQGSREKKGVRGINSCGTRNFSPSSRPSTRWESPRSSLFFLLELEATRAICETCVEKLVFFFLRSSSSSSSSATGLIRIELETDGARGERAGTANEPVQRTRDRAPPPPAGARLGRASPAVHSPPAPLSPGPPRRGRGARPPGTSASASAHAAVLLALAHLPLRTHESRRAARAPRGRGRRDARGRSSTPCVAYLVPFTKKAPGSRRSRTREGTRVPGGVQQTALASPPALQQDDGARARALPAPPCAAPAPPGRARAGALSSSTAREKGERVRPSLPFFKTRHSTRSRAGGPRPSHRLSPLLFPSVCFVLGCFVKLSQRRPSTCLRRERREESE